MRKRKRYFENKIGIINVTAYSTDKCPKDNLKYT